jgi:chemotaxis protein methyltransferase CheR
VDAEIFRRFQELAYDEAGIWLRPGKEVLVSARLAKRIRELGLESESAYLDLLRGADGGEEVVRFLDAITTNHTTFFREPIHFEIVTADVERRVAEGQRRFRFWCAGCSTGEEPYTLALTLAQLIPDLDWRILATDISTRVLAAAQAGVYSEASIEPVPREALARYFRRVETPKGPAYEASDALRSRLVFRRVNLSERPFPLRGPLDAVFCRNVMIYFDEPMRRGVVQEVERLLAPGGVFFIGHSESLGNLAKQLRCERPSVYRLT